MQPTTPTTVLINAWFNSFPIRVLGTHEDPVFYASEIGNILGLTQISKSITHFGEREIVSNDQLTTRGIQPTTITQAGKEIAAPRAIMLTEAGVYRLIMASRSALADPLRKHLYDALHAARLAETERLRLAAEQTQAQIVAANRKLRAELKEYRRAVPVIHIFRRELAGADPYTLILPEDREPDADNLPASDDLTDPKYIYKYTTRPCPADYAAFTLKYKIYGQPAPLFDEIQQCDGLAINAAAQHHCVYTVGDDVYEFDVDCVIHKV